MQDNNEGGVDIIRQALEKHLQGVDASGRRSDANGRKPLPGRSLARSSLVLGRTDPMIIVTHLGSEGCAEDTRIAD